MKLTKPAPLSAPFLSSFKRLAGWGNAEPGGPVPALAFMTASFRLAVAVMTLPAFPVNILGTVVNKRARYSLLRSVAADEPLTFACR